MRCACGSGAYGPNIVQSGWEGKNHNEEEYKEEEERGMNEVRVWFWHIRLEYRTLQPNLCRGESKKGKEYKEEEEDEEEEDGWID